MRVYLAIEDLLLNPGNWGSVLKKYSIKFGNCSISFPKTLSRLIHREKQCFSRRCVSTPVTFETSWKCSRRLDEYLKKKWKFVAISDRDQRFLSILSPIFQMHYWPCEGHIYLFPGKWQLFYDSPLDRELAGFWKLTFGPSIPMFRSSFTLRWFSSKNL